jgi:indolepyruvate ferredoxin oxidoreductase, beta subunit
MSGFSLEYEHREVRDRSGCLCWLRSVHRNMPLISYYKGGEPMNLYNKDPLNLVIAGVGGQGNVLISKLVGQTMINDGYKVTVGETFGASQRGGSVTSHVRISRDNQYGAQIPEGHAHVILGLEPVETLRYLIQNGSQETLVVTNTRPLYPMCVATGESEYPPMTDIKDSIEELSKKAWYINASEIALNFGNALLTNIIVVGALTGLQLIALKPDKFEQQLAATFRDEKLELNLKAFRAGLSYNFT